MRSVRIHRCDKEVGARCRRSGQREDRRGVFRLDRSVEACLLEYYLDLAGELL